MPSAERVRRHREVLRASGFRPVQLWVPDTRDPAFIAECRRQSSMLKDDPQEKDALEMLDEIADRSGWS